MKTSNSGRTSISGKKDDELKLVDAPEVSVVEDNNNLVLTFNERVVYEAGDKITIWCSELVEREVKKRTVTEQDKAILTEKILDFKKEMDKFNQ